MTISFYPENKISNKFEKSIKEILNEFSKTYNHNAVFHSSLLIFMANEYGSFDKLTDNEWDEIYKLKSKLNL